MRISFIINFFELLEVKNIKGKNRKYLSNMDEQKEKMVNNKDIRETEEK